MSGDQTIQSDQYEFPYHHLVDVRGETPKFRHHLGWGLEYAFYQMYIRDQLLAKGYQRVLDVGCGDGWMVRELYRHGLQASGIDTDDRAIQLAKALCPQAEFISGNVQDLNRSFEAVTALEVFEHIPNGLDLEILKKCWSLVARGGSLYITVPSKVRPVHKKHFRHYDRATMEAFLRDAGIKSKDTELRFLCKDTALYRIFLKLTNNRKCAVHIPAFDRAVWRHYRRAALEADDQNGLHVCLVVRK